ncbi:hypothetical protein HanHA300_Chr07g0234481 [Helianthus annuus]|nr:hypothetical protein HanHA300_Chr07g0234481 [Helianthus annuus]KAJ0562461.1 hypothetical protein HanHA89_Chr07g0251671 [Helianthus annuus]KAJ0727837.1 hypothetical protein HanLR1_Chr07g0234441 [Helianthus annuus]
MSEIESLSNKISGVTHISERCSPRDKFFKPTFSKNDADSCSMITNLGAPELSLRMTIVILGRTCALET